MYFNVLTMLTLMNSWRIFQCVAPYDNLMYACIHSRKWMNAPMHTHLNTHVKTPLRTHTHTHLHNTHTHTTHRQHTYIHIQTHTSAQTKLYSDRYKFNTCTYIRGSSKSFSFKFTWQVCILHLHDN